MWQSAGQLPKGSPPLIEERWNLQPLGTRDAAAGDLQTAFDFSQN